MEERERERQKRKEISGAGLFSRLLLLRAGEWRSCRARALLFKISMETALVAPGRQASRLGWMGDVSALAPASLLWLVWTIWEWEEEEGGGRLGTERCDLSWCAHKAEHTLQKHVKEFMKLVLTLAFLQLDSKKKKKKGTALFVSIKRALSLMTRDFTQRAVIWDECSRSVKQIVMLQSP